MNSVCIDVGFVCLILLLATNPLAGQSSTCRYGKQHGYFAAECSGMNLWDVPTLQSTDIEALDLSNNRLRALKNNTLKCCTSIKFLYLQINGILNIEANALQPLTELNVLDLSWNGFDKLPTAVSPTLRKLYLEGVPKLFENLQNNEFKITHLKNLESLTISANELKKFPSFGGSVPSLLELNITDNYIEEITPDDLAPLCQLKFLHVGPDTLFMNKDAKTLCQCMKLANWTSAYNIQVSSFTCKYDKSTILDKCDLRPSNVTLAKREACLTEMKNRQIPYWLMIGGGILAAITCICILLYVRYRRRQRESAKNGHDRNSAVKYDNKGDENNERPEEDKLLKQ
ncbi:podocan-like protein 1 isoform X2 [Planococcus citri]|uniref:podocan-like protein 1 isoform X2 n=1 Tax=Planococcus citri TaxID=170843 RepID=UPI0031F8987B